MASLVHGVWREPTLHVHEVRDDLALELGAEGCFIGLRVVDIQRTLQHLRVVLCVGWRARGMQV